MNDLPSAVHDQRRLRGTVHEETASPRFGGLSLEAIGAAGRETLFPPGAEASFNADSGRIALGALVGALFVASDEAVTVARLPAPWEVAHPGLLDPVMWLIGTAYASAALMPGPA